MKINETHLIVLKQTKDKSKVYIEYLNIVTNDLVSKKVAQFDLLYREADFHSLIEFLLEELQVLIRDFSHCKSLKDAYQNLPADEISYFQGRYKEAEEELKKCSSTDDKKKESIRNNMFEIKTHLYDSVHRRFEALNFENTYKHCAADKDILTYSHRKIGWKEVVDNLTPNFKFEIDTNFGYGPVSYFYTKLMYKGIEIFPFSDWITYPYANFSELIRYTKKYELKDECWLDAIVYANEACNLSLTNESAFVNKYIVSECENMVKGLENILTNCKFKYHIKEIKSSDKRFIIDEKTNLFKLVGHQLIEFRGEKLSGALNFIGKFLSFEKIRNMHQYIDRIKNMNLKLLPILKAEIPLISNEMISLNKTFDELKNKLTEIQEVNKEQAFNLQDYILKNTKNGTSDEKTELRDMFVKLNPQYSQSLEEFKIVKQDYDDTNRQMSALNLTKRNIETYVNQIQDYFKHSK